MFDDAKGDNEVDYLDKEASNRFFKAMMEADKAKGLFADMREDEERFDLFKSFNPDRKDGYTLADYTKAFIVAVEIKKCSGLMKVYLATR